MNRDRLSAIADAPSVNAFPNANSDLWNIWHGYTVPSEATLTEVLPAPQHARTDKARMGLNASSIEAASPLRATATMVSASSIRHGSLGIRSPKFARGPLSRLKPTVQPSCFDSSM